MPTGMSAHRCKGWRRTVSKSSEKQDKQCLKRNSQTQHTRVTSNYIIRLPGGLWSHAFELRFLTGDLISPPSRLGNKPSEFTQTPSFSVIVVPPSRSLGKKSAQLMPTPDGLFLCANLIIGAQGTTVDSPLPPEFAAGGLSLWRTRLRNGRPALLVVRLLELDYQNREWIWEARHERRPTVTLSSMPADPYLELYEAYLSAEGGNVIGVFPMGKEAVRLEREISTLGKQPQEPRRFRYSSPRSCTELFAPDGRPIATFFLNGIDNQIELVKGIPKRVELGLLTMRIEPSNLISGSAFVASPHSLVCVPTVDGVSPRGWKYTILARFDGIGDKSTFCFGPSRQ